MREAIAVCQSLPGPLAIQVGIFICLSARRLLGRVGRRLGLHPAELRHRRGARRAVRAFRRTQPVTAIFYGVSPAVIALILHSCYRLAKLGMEDGCNGSSRPSVSSSRSLLQAEVAFLFIGAGVVGILYYGTLFGAAAAPTARCCRCADRASAPLRRRRALNARQAVRCSSSRPARSPSAAAS